MARRRKTGIAALPDGASAPLDALVTETPLNGARLHPEANLDLLQKSLQELGAARSIVIDENGHVLAGKGTTLAARMAGLAGVRIIDATGDELIAVRRRGLTQEQKLRLAIYDNRANDLSDWDLEALAPLAEAGILDDLLDLGDLPGMDLPEELLQALDEATTAERETAQKAADIDDDLPPVPDALFPTDNDFGIPLLDLEKQATAIHLPALIWGASSRKTHAGTWLFYTEDYRYSKLWRAPNDVLATRCHAAAEPNYSCYGMMPQAIALYRIFQKRWIARYWQENGIGVLVDLNVNPAFYDINFLGVPKGWKAYATRGYSDRLHETHEEFERAKAHAGTSSIMAVVYGGGRRVKEEAQRSGWTWIPEVMDTRKGREAEFDG